MSLYLAGTEGDNTPVIFSGPPPFCPRCIHYFVTWDPSFPKGCRLFGIKSRRLPSAEVREANQRDCPSFTPKEGVD